MDEAQALADRVAVIVAGEIVAVGPPAQLGGRASAPSTIRFALADAVELPAWDSLAEAPRRTGGFVELRTHAAVEVLHALTGWAIDNGHPLAGLVVSQPSLEDIYLQLTATPDEAGG